MASLRKLKIQGIRSFNPKKPETIKFYSPLTVIVGQNGCGKTTIIESIAHAICGIYPTGSKGAAWIHDTKMSGESSVKATVALMFSARDKKHYLISRGYEVKKRGTRTTMSGLDSTLKSGNKKASNLKKTEADAVVPKLFGTSQALLENVIFCHQEDSNWPLTKSTELKKKFDALFEATRYTKALAQIKDKKKEVKKRMDSLESEVVRYRGLVKEADGLKKYIEEANAQVQKAEEVLSETLASKSSLDQQIDEAEKIVLRTQESWNQLQVDKKLFRERSRKWKSNFDGLASKSDMLLQQITREDAAKFNAAAEVQRNSLANCEKEVRKQETLLRQREKALQDLDVTEAKLLERKNQQRGLMKSFRDLRRKVDAHQRKTNYVGAGGSQRFDDEDKDVGAADCERLKRLLQNQLDNCRRKLKELKDAAAVELSKVEEESKNVAVDFFSCEKEIASCKAQETKLKHDIQTVQRGLESKKAEVAQVKTLKAKYRQAEAAVNGREFAEKLERAQQAVRASVEELKQKRAAVDDYSQTIKTLERMQPLLFKCDSLRGQIRTKNEQRASKLSSIRSKSGSSLLEVDDDDSGDQIKNELLEQQLERTTELVRVSDEAAMASKHMAAVNARATQLQERVDAVTAQKRDLHGRLSAFRAEIEANDLDISNEDAVNKFIEEVERKSGTTEEKSRQRKVYIDYLDGALKAIQSRSVCPTCAQHVQSVPTAEQHIRQRVQAFEGKIAASMAAGNLKKVHTMLCNLRPSWMHYLTLDNELCGLKLDLQDAEGDRKTARDDFDRHNSAKNDAVNALKKADLLLNMANDFKALSAELMDLKADLKQAEREMSMQNTLDLESAGVDWKSSASLSECRRRASLLEEAAKSASDALDRSKTAEDRCRREQNDAKGSLLRLKEQLGDAERADQSISGEEARLEELTLQCTTVRERRNALLSEKQRLLQKRADSSQALERVRRQQDEKLERSAEARDVTFNLHAECSQLLSHFQGQSADSGDGSELERLQAEAKRHRTEMSKIQEQLTRCRADERKLRTNIHELEDHLVVVNQAIVLNEEYDALNAEKGTLKTRETDLVNLRGGVRDDDVKKLRDLRRDIEKRSGPAEGCKSTNLRHIAMWNAKLAEPEYETCDRLLQNFLTEQTVCKAHEISLDESYKAVDQAVMKYHKLKVDEINAIIADFWAKTYSGDDIVAIKIFSETEKKDKGRASYNYMVIMLKAGCEEWVEMRGRCSAGQKVLSCIVIRLALAQCFGVHCNILALDEPTTNLDQGNKEKLAVSLGNLLAQMAVDGGTDATSLQFQLIVITHDQDFVSLLGESLTGARPEYYIRVSRHQEDLNNQYYSQIRRLNWTSVLAGAGDGSSEDSESESE